MLGNNPETSCSDEISFHHMTPTGSVEPAPGPVPPPSPKTPDLPITIHVDNVAGDNVRLWRSGQPYQYPVPKPDGDPWEIVLASLMRKDKLQCSAWKEQIQSILVVVWFLSLRLTGITKRECSSRPPCSRQ